MIQPGKTRGAGAQSRVWRVFTPALWLMAMLILGLAIRTQLSVGQRAMTDVTDLRSVEQSATSASDASRVTPIEHEIQPDQNDCIVTASATEGMGPAVVEDSDLQSSDARLRGAIPGKWEDEYRGKRHLTVADDGTGTMVVEPDGLGRRLFADQLSFNLEWSIADGRVTMTMLGGEPQSKVNLILKLHGREARYKILNLDDDQMLLLDPDGKTRYDWRRPASTESK